MSKKKYHHWSLEKMEELKQAGIKPRLLLHVCCAPCSVYVFDFLNQYFEITAYFNNDNIFPFTEYELRKEELLSLIKQLNHKEESIIQVVNKEFQGEIYHEQLKPFAMEKEGGERCGLCYRLRMEDAYQYAVKEEFDYMTTVMTISRQKNSERMNEIGKELERKYPTVAYFYSDFKKEDGILKRNLLVKEYGLYKQQYCGCFYSYQQYLEKKVQKEYNDLKGVVV